MAKNMTFEEMLERILFKYPLDERIDSSELSYIMRNYGDKKNLEKNIENFELYLKKKSQIKEFEKYNSIKEEEQQPLISKQAYAEFYQNPNCTLNFNSPHFLKTDENIIILSITRDINSIIYALNITEKVKKIAYNEALKQGLTIGSNTPFYLLYNKDIIKSSIKKDITTIDKVPKDAWDSELISFAYNMALKSKYVLSNNSPSFLNKDLEVIKQSLKLDYKTVKYINWSKLNVDDVLSLTNYIIDNNINFLLDENTPQVLRRNSILCLKSSSIDFNSVKYFDWQYFENNPLMLENIFLNLVNQKFVLTAKTPEILTNNVGICLASVKNDIKSASFFSQKIKYWLHNDLDKYPVNKQADESMKMALREIRNYLILNGYYSLEEFFSLGSFLLKDEQILNFYLKQLDINASDDFFKKIHDFIQKNLKASLKVESVHKVLQMVALKKWEVYRKENNDYYTNVFNRICDSLEKNNNFIVALNELKFLLKLDDVIEDRKYALFNAFIDYHQIYHSNSLSDKIDELQAKREDISHYASLFVSKSKDDFIKEKVKELEQAYKMLFVIRSQNPWVKKKIVEVKQRDMLKKLYKENDGDLSKKIDDIKKKYLVYNYSEIINKDKLPQIIDLFISHSVKGDVSSVDDILKTSKPERFDEYEFFEKTRKVINRLNSHNISFEDKTVEKYRGLIDFDGQKYRYSGAYFSEYEIKQILGYKDLKYVFGKVKSEIINLAKNIEEFEKLTIDDIKMVMKESPFNDEYYECDKNFLVKSPIKIYNELIKHFNENQEVLLDDDLYNIICNLFIESGLLHFIDLSRLSSHKNINDILAFISEDELCQIIDTLPSLLTMLSKDEIKIENLNKVLEFKDIFKYADLKQIGLLGKEVVQKIYSNSGYTSSTAFERLKVAYDLARAMMFRNYSTVPYVSGVSGNYKYAIYDRSDTSVLTSGIDTNSCFRCLGNDNDFLHYCLLDKNGFVLKITDLEGNFIGRASGFRNGNGVYINQLRTIYDQNSSAYASEKNAIITAFKTACNDIVETSQKNIEEENKIDFAIVTRSYTLKDISFNVDNQTESAIGNSPMDNQSEDWQNFVATTKNLKESQTLGRFNLDFGGYKLICMSSNLGILSPEKIKKGDVPAVYKRKRKEIKVYSVSQEVENAVNKIRNGLANRSYLKLPIESKVVLGDNWYIVTINNDIFDSCFLGQDKDAEKEFLTYINLVRTDEFSLKER